MEAQETSQSETKTQQIDSNRIEVFEVFKLTSIPKVFLFLSLFSDQISRWN